MLIIVRELVMIRDGLLGLSEKFSCDDVCTLITYLCVLIFNFSFYFA